MGNLGLRWEYNSGLTDIRDRVFRFRKGQQSTVFPDSPVGIVYGNALDALDPNEKASRTTTAKVQAQFAVDATGQEG